MRWFLAITSLSITLVARGQGDGAEKLFRAMEKKVRAAKALKLVCELDGRLSAGGEERKIKAYQQFAGPNQARFELKDGTFGSHSLFVSDGKQAVLREDGRLGKPKKADPNLNAGIAGAIARGGFMLPRLVDRQESGSFNAEKTLLLGEFKLGAKERIGKVDAQSIEHSVKFGGTATGPAASVKVTVWIDPKTLVPLKRKVVVGSGELDFFTEVYSEFMIDPKLDEKTFALPK